MLHLISSPPSPNPPGLCLEKLPISSSASNLHVDREQEIVTCYEKAGDIALLYLQEIERVSWDDLLIEELRGSSFIDAVLPFW